MCHLEVEISCRYCLSWVEEKHVNELLRDDIEGNHFVGLDVEHTQDSCEVLESRLEAVADQIREVELDRSIKDQRFIDALAEIFKWLIGSIFFLVKINKLLMIWSFLRKSWIGPLVLACPGF